jgi:hypothetical protein
MDVNGNDRRWSATITYADEYMDLCLSPARGETVQAELPDNDLQKSMLAGATLEAAQYLLAGCAKHAYVVLHKTTKANGTVRDKSLMLDVNDAAMFVLRYLNRPSWRI